MIRTLFALRRVGRRIRLRDPRNVRTGRAALWMTAIGCVAVFIDWSTGLAVIGLMVACGAITLGCDLVVGVLRLRGVRAAMHRPPRGALTTYPAITEARERAQGERP